MALVLLLASCTPFQANAPVGRRQGDTCAWVREQVRLGALPLDLARTHYPFCGPFEAPE